MRHQSTSAEEIIHHLYQSTVDEALWPDILTQISTLFGAKVAMLGSYDFESNRGRKSCVIGLESAYLKSSGEVYSATNPWARESLLGAIGIVRTGRHLISDESLRRTRFHDEWLRPQGLFHSMRGVLDYRDREIRFIGLIRDVAKPNFDETEVSQFTDIVAHAQRAYRISLSQNSHIELANASIAAFDHIPFGVAIVDENGAVLAANRLAGKFTLERDRVAFGPKCIALGVPADKRKLLDMVAGRGVPSRSTNDDGHLSIERSDDRRPISILVSSAPKSIGPHGPRVAMAALLISDPDSRIVINPESLRSAYQLTASEARLTAAFAEGISLQEVARRLDITYETARTYLKRTYGKTNTSRQAELIRLVHAVVSHIDTR